VLIGPLKALAPKDAPCLRQAHLKLGTIGP
jgi:hypothetical protein